MNEHAPATAASPNADRPQTSALRKVLFGVLAIMLIALAYEYGYVLPSYRRAETAIDNLLDRQIQKDTTPTVKDVQAAMGKQPSGGLEDKGHYFVEHYQWRRGLPWQTFNIYVIYDHADPPQLYYATRPDAPTQSDVPPVGYVRSSASEIVDFPAPQPTAGGRGRRPPMHGEGSDEAPEATRDASETVADSGDAPTESADAAAEESETKPTEAASDEPAEANVAAESGEPNASDEADAPANPDETENN